MSGILVFLPIYLQSMESTTKQTKQWEYIKWMNGYTLHGIYGDMPLTLYDLGERISSV